MKCCCTRHVGRGHLCPVCPVHGFKPTDDDDLTLPNKPDSAMPTGAVVSIADRRVRLALEVEDARS
jgi:hypothetical protein